MKKLYKKKHGFVLRTNAETVGKEIDRIAKKYKTKYPTPDQILKEAKNQKNPIHKEFIWDNSLAAEKYRRCQAQYLIRSIEIEIIAKPKVIKKLNVVIESKPFRVGIPGAKGKCTYPKFDDVAKNSDDKEKIKIKVAKEFKAVYNKTIQYYGLLGSSFDNVFDAVERIIN